MSARVTDPPQRARLGARARGAFLVLLIVLVAAPVIVRALRVSRSGPCPPPPAPLGVDVRVLPAELLPSMIPDSIPGFVPAGERPIDIATEQNRSAKSAFVMAGFISGYTRNFRTATTTVTYSVLQFPTPEAAVRYEAARIGAFCKGRNAMLSVPQGTGASAMAIMGSGGASHRYSVVRGSREYVMAVVAHDVSGDLELFERFVAGRW